MSKGYRSLGSTAAPNITTFEQLLNRSFNLLNAFYVQVRSDAEIDRDSALA